MRNPAIRPVDQAENHRALHWLMIAETPAFRGSARRTAEAEGSTIEISVYLGGIVTEIEAGPKTDFQHATHTSPHRALRVGH